MDQACSQAWHLCTGPRVTRKGRLEFSPDEQGLLFQSRRKVTGKSSVVTQPVIPVFGELRKGQPGLQSKHQAKEGYILGPCLKTRTKPNKNKQCRQPSSQEPRVSEWEPVLCEAFSVFSLSCSQVCVLIPPNRLCSQSNGLKLLTVPERTLMSREPDVT